MLGLSHTWTWFYVNVLSFRLRVASKLIFSMCRMNINKENEVTAGPVVVRSLSRSKRLQSLRYLSCVNLHVEAAFKFCC